MVRLLVRHKVHDYAVWRKGYDAFESTRIKLGAQGHAVYGDVETITMLPRGTTLTISRRPRHSPSPRN